MQKQLGFLLQKFVIQINSLAKLVEQTLSDKSEKLAEVFAMQSWVEMQQGAFQKACTLQKKASKIVEEVYSEMSP